jgi:hypothetical protein
MKKLVIILFLGLNFIVFAQKREKGNIEVTLPIGYSDYSYFYTYDDMSNSVYSVSFGALGDYYFNEKWSFRTGVLYQTMGGSFDVQGSIIEPQKNINPKTLIIGEEKLGYLCFPMNMNWHFGSTRSWNLNFGLTPSFLLSAKGDYVFYGEVDLKEYVNPFQMGFSGGVGYKFPISENLGFLVDIQFFESLSTILKDSNEELTNSGICIDIGLVFKI